MKWHQWRDARRLAVAVTCLVALTAAFLLTNGGPQATLAVGESLDTSTKEAFPEIVSPNGEVTYQIVVRSSSDTSGDVIVEDALPTGLTYVSDSAAVSPEGAGTALPQPALNRVTYTLLPMDAGDEVTLTLKALVASGLDSGEQITNTAVISDGTATLEKFAVVTVEGPPTARLDAPWDNQLITQRDTFEVKGRVWTESQDPEFPNPPTLNPISYAPGDNFYFVTWTSVSDALSYVLEEADNPNFSNAVEYASLTTTTREFTNKAEGTYYYRVKARNIPGESFWSNVVSVDVTSSRLAAEAGTTDVVAPTAFSYEPVVEVNIRKVGEAGTWTEVATVEQSSKGDWWDWSYDWDLPQEDDAQYIVEVRAMDLADNFDAALNDTVTVTIQNGTRFIYLPIIAKRYPPIPYPPALSLTSNDTWGNYTLSWSYNHPECPACVPTSYRFQESTDANFDTLTINEIRTSPQQFTNKPAGTYYYRVQGVNANGNGEWSQTVTVDVNTRGFSDDFSNSGSGWPRKTYYSDNRAVFNVDYENGSYRAKILRNDFGLNNKWMGIVKAPWDNTLNHYEVEVDHYFAKADDATADPTWGKAGLIFGADSSYKNSFILEWNYDLGTCAVIKYDNIGSEIVVVWTAGGVPKRDWAACPIKTGYNQVNEARAVVNGNHATLYMNDAEIYSFTDDDLGNRHKVGLMTGAWERTPVESRFDNFRVTAR